MNVPGPRSIFLLPGVILTLAFCGVPACGGGGQQGAPPNPDASPEAGPPLGDASGPDGGMDATPMDSADAPPVIADPTAVVGAAIDGKLAGLQTIRESEDGAALTETLALAERALAEARTAFAELSPEDQQEVARVLALPGDDALAFSEDDPPPTQADIDCARRLTSWDDEVNKGSAAAAAATTWQSSRLKWLIARAFAINSYIEGWFIMGKVGVICNMEQNFEAFETASTDGRSSPFRLTADHRTFIDSDAVTNEVVKRAGNVKRNVLSLYMLIKDLFTDDGDTVQEPNEPEQGRVVETDVEVEPERVWLTTSSILGEDGTTTAIELVRSGKTMALRAVGELKRTVQRTVGFKIVRKGFAFQLVEVNATVLPACLENGQLVPGCVRSVEVLSDSTVLAIGGTTTLTAKAFSEDGDLLERAIRWSSSDDTVVTVTAPAGAGQAEVKALKFGAPVTITATAGSGASARTGSATITITEPDESEKYRLDVIGTWTVTNVDGPSPPWSETLEIRPGGTGAYHTKISTDPNNPCNGRVQNGGHCEFPISWTVTRTGPLKYVLREGGFWHPAYGGDIHEPLTYPVTGFKTYSIYDPTHMTRIYTKN